MAKVTNTYTFPQHIKGDTFNGQLFRYTTTDGVTSTPIDLTGASAKMQLKESAQSSAVFTFSSVDGNITFPNPSNGELQLEPVIIDVDAGEYEYDLQITFPTGVVQSYLRGKFPVINDITRT